MHIVTADEMRRLDRDATNTYGIPVLLLMEQAGMGVVREMEHRFGDLSGRSVMVLAGKGHNGGDAVVAARHLLQRGADVTVFLAVESHTLQGEPRQQCEMFCRIGGRLDDPSRYDRTTVRAALAETDLCVDGLFGTGLSSTVGGLAAELIAELNASGKPIIAVDIPSGINADTGEVFGDAVRAALTVTFALPKRGHFLSPGTDYVGRLRVVDIGIPRRAIEQAALPLSLFTESAAAPLVPTRPRDSHKGMFGHVLVVAGSAGKGGAAMLAARSALRAGAGLVTLACPETVLRNGEERSPEVMTLPLPETAEHTLASNSLERLLVASKQSSVVAIGPGLSTHPETQAVIRELVARLSQPIVLDADGLNALADHLEPLSRSHPPMVLTPHPGEMARLAKIGTREVQRRRIEVAMEFAGAHRVTVVLKGSRTVVATPDGFATLNSTGNAGMATAGTGDVLTGIIAAMIAQGVAPEGAARLGAYLHGMAGDLVATERGERGLLAGDLIDRLPSALARLAPAHQPPQRLFKQVRTTLRSEL